MGKLYYTAETIIIIIMTTKSCSILSCESSTINLYKNM